MFTLVFRLAARVRVFFIFCYRVSIEKYKTSMLNKLFSQFLRGTVGIVWWGCLSAILFWGVVFARAFSNLRPSAAIVRVGNIISVRTVARELAEVELEIARKKDQLVGAGLLLREAIRRVKEGNRLLRGEMIRFEEGQGEDSSDLDYHNSWLNLEANTARELGESISVLTKDLSLLEERKCQLVEAARARQDPAIRNEPLRSSKQLPGARLSQRSIDRPAAPQSPARL